MKDIRYPKHLLDHRPVGRKKKTWRIIKETIRRIQSWGRNRPFIVN